MDALTVLIVIALIHCSLFFFDTLFKVNQLSYNVLFHNFILKFDTNNLL